MQLKEAQIDGHAVRYAEAGSGPPLLLVHGFLVSHLEWEAVLPLLSRHYRCIAPDLPGFGQSDKPAPGAYGYTREAFAGTMHGLLGHLGIEKAHVAGHSMGGSVALVLAADFGASVDRLVLIDTACYPFPVPLKGRLPLLPLLGPLIFKRLYGRSLFRDYFQNDVFSGHDGLDLTRVDTYYDDFRPRASRDAAYEALLQTVSLESLGPKIGKVTAETLILWGDEDRIFPPGLAHRLVRELPHARLDIIEGSGHAPNEEHPTVLADKVHAFLGGG